MPSLSQPLLVRPSPQGQREGLEKDQAMEHLNKLDIHKSIGPDRMHTGVLSETADVIARPLLITFEMSWQLGEVTEKTERKQMSLLSSRRKM